MPLNVETFRSLVGQTRYGNRDIIVSGEGKNATARLGNFFFSQGKAANNATMKAFKEALEKEYGSLGTHAFDQPAQQVAARLRHPADALQARAHPREPLPGRG